MNERVPPFSEEAERASLGAMLLDGIGMVQTARTMGLDPDDWWVPGLRAIAAAIWAVADEPRPAIDLVTVGNKLQAEGKLEEVGGASALDGLVDKTPTAAHGEYYLDIVLQKSRLRQVIEAAREIEQEAFEAERADRIVVKAPEMFAGVIGPDQKTETNREAGQHLIEAWEAAKRGEKAQLGMELPWPTLTDLMCGLEPGITILAGRPSAGKTTVEDQICCHAAGKLGIPVGRFTLDGSRQKLMGRAMCRMAGVSMPKLKMGKAREDQLAKCREALEVLGEYPMWIMEKVRDVRAICSIARDWRRRHGVKLITIDYVQQITDADMGRHQHDANVRISHIMSLLQPLSLELEHGVLLLSQLRRLNPQEKDKGKPPCLEDLRDSGALEQDAEKVAFVYQDAKAHKEMEDREEGSTKTLRPTLVDVQKNKDSSQDVVPFWFHTSYFRFEETAGFDRPGTTSGGGTPPPSREPNRAPWEEPEEFK